MFSVLLQVLLIQSIRLVGFAFFFFFLLPQGLILYS